MTLAEQFGRRLFLARRRLGVSQEALSVAAGFHRGTVNGLENGRRSPGLETTVTLAYTLGIDPGVLVQGMKPDPASEREPERCEPVRPKFFVPFAGGREPR